MNTLNRDETVKVLKALVKRPGSDLVYLRGRRRVGKSWLLQHFKSQVPNYFYFMGQLDASARSQLEQCAVARDHFTRREQLGDLRPERLRWSTLFKAISEHAKALQQPLVLAFDEIQWLAKTGSGFISSLKEAWQHWEEERVLDAMASLPGRSLEDRYRM